MCGPVGKKGVWGVMGTGGGGRTKEAAGGGVFWQNEPSGHNLISGGREGGVKLRHRSGWEGDCWGASFVGGDVGGSHVAGGERKIKLTLICAQTSAWVLGKPWIFHQRFLGGGT